MCFPEPTEQIFLSGYCGAFAVVLHNKHPWPLGVFVLRTESDYPDEAWRTTIAHAVCEIPSKGLVADVKGPRPKEEVYPDLRYSSEPDDIGFEEITSEQELINRMLIRRAEIDFAARGYRKFEGRFG